MYVCSFTHIGKRKNQEDRFVFCPDLLEGEYGFYGIFDGTVKEYASEWIHKNILSILLESKSFVQFHALAAKAKQDTKNTRLLENALREMYATADAQLIQYCTTMKYDYTSCTSVTVLLHFPSNTMLVAHLGDSHAVIGTPARSRKDSSSSRDSAAGKLEGHRLTEPHRPDHPNERKRIEAAGGSVVYLHDCNNKPFIRGGDFHQRNHAMQLNYSRAFGGKDLKMYGLSSIPDLCCVRSNFLGEKEKEKEKTGLADVKCLLLGSDGVWDVLQPEDAVNVAYKIHLQFLEKEKEKSKGGAARSSVTSRSSTSTSAAVAPTTTVNAAERLAMMALAKHEQIGSNDNVTVLAIFFPSITPS
jgi:protein phosphatase